MADPELDLEEAGETGKLRERAYDSFTRRLLSRELKAGQFVSQRELVAMTGLTIGAIRELVPRLEAEGLIRTIPQRGMQIAHVDMNLIRDAFQFRLLIEREAFAVYAEKAPDSAIANWRAAHEAILARLQDGADDAALAFEAQKVDDTFHADIVDALGNLIISNAHRVNALKIRLIRYETTRIDPSLVRPVMEEHLGLIEAIESRNGLLAADAISRHLANARNRAMGLA